MNRLGAEPRDEAADANDRFARRRHRAHIRSIENSTENAASATITRKIDSTTDKVVSRPTLSALRAT